MPILAILKLLWSYRSLAPWALLAVLGLWIRIDESRLRAYLRENSAKATQLRELEDANRNDTQAIAGLRSALSDLTSKLVAAQSSAAAAELASVLATQDIRHRLDVATTDLANLEKDSSYASFLATDVDAKYPELASSLRKLDADHQD